MNKKSVVHVQSCCFANTTHCFFFTSSLPSASLDLKVPNDAGSRARNTKHFKNLVIVVVLVLKSEAV